MKSLMKFALVKALLFLMTTGVAAQTTTNAYVSGSVVTGNGPVAEVDVYRSQDPTTGLITTQLFYNWCPAPSTNVGCQGGAGVIPNSAFSGIVYDDNLNRRDTLTLSIDTNAVPGFRNYLCFNDQYSYCAIQSATSGGIISMSWTRTNAWATLDTSSEKQYKLGKKMSATNFEGAEFSADPAGTVLGDSVTGAASPTSDIIGSSTNSTRLAEKFAARKGSQQ
jgi:hypothetical protein